MSKAFIIITGTAEYVSQEVTRLQNEEYLLRDGFCFTHMKTIRGAMEDERMVPMFAQPMFRKWEEGPVTRQTPDSDGEKGEQGDG